MENKRQKLADAARKVAVELKNGAQYGVGSLFKDNKPHCVIGHILYKAGHDPFTVANIYSSGYEILEDGSGFRSDDIYSFNDDLFRKNAVNCDKETLSQLRSTLITNITNYADQMEKLAKKDLPNEEAVIVP